MMRVIVKPMPSDARTRMIRSAAELFRERGLTATSFSDVIERSGAPRGSIYHHFPGGKAQLAEETVHWAGERIAVVVDGAAEGGDPIALLRSFVSLWRASLESSGFAAGCPVVAAAVENAPEMPAVAAAAGEEFQRWERAFTRALRAASIPKARSERLATLSIAAIEGAIVLCRATQDIGPLDRVGRELELALRDAMGD